MKSRIRVAAVISVLAMLHASCGSPSSSTSDLHKSATSADHQYVKKQIANSSLSELEKNKAIADYGKYRPELLNLAELLEQGDYDQFKKEFRALFPGVAVPSQNELARLTANHQSKLEPVTTTLIVAAVIWTLVVRSTPNNVYKESAKS